jgi:hypothetical protein
MPILLSTAISPNVGIIKSWVRITSNYTALNGDKLIADTTSGSFTVTMPATPSAGHSVQITDGGSWRINNLLVNFNGATIEGVNDTLSINIPQTTIELVYDGTTWQLISTTGARGSSDEAAAFAIALGF